MRTTYRDIRERVLYDREKALLRLTQAHVESQFVLEQLELEWQGLENKYNEIRKQRTIALQDLRYSNTVMPISEAIDKYLQLHTAAEIVDEQLQDEQSMITAEIDKLNGKKLKTVRTYILGCTRANCKGLLSREIKDRHGYYHCIICSSSTCCDCHSLIEGLHVCDPDMLKTIQFMKSTSKPCPGCNVRIHRISGCFQMFCTVCLTSWDWNTCRVNSGVVHNPHHAEWLRYNRPREVGHLNCGLNMDIAVSMVQVFDRQIKENCKGRQADVARQCSSYMFNAIRVAIHHHSVTIPALTHRGEDVNASLRTDLLRGFVSEVEFKREIQRKDKASCRRADLLNVVTTYRDALIDIILPFTEPHNHSIDQWMIMVKELKALECYVNDCFVKVFETFGSTSKFEILSDKQLR